MQTQGFPLQNQPPLVGVPALFNQVWFQFFQTLWNRLGGAQVAAVVPSGAMLPCGGPVQDGYILCDGSAVSRTEYAALFAVIGTRWGAGDGSTTFNVPDMVDRFPVGAGNLYALGDTGGAASVELTTAQLPAHNHAVTDPGHTHNITDPGHTHTVSDPGHVHSSVVAASNVTTGTSAGGVTAGNTGSATTGITNQSAMTGVATVATTTGVTTQNTGSGTAVPTLPPYAAVTWMIKT